MTKTDNSDAYKIHYSMMHASGVWPEENSTIIYKVKAFFSWFCAFGLCLTMIIEVVYDLTDFTKLSEILYIMVTVATTAAKLASFTYHRKKFMSIINFLKDPVFMSYSDDLDHYMATTVKYSTLITNCYRFGCACCIIFMSTYPIIDNTPLPFPFPYELGNYRFAMYAFQSVSIGLSAWNNSTFDTLTTCLMGVGVAQLDILCEKLIRIQNTISGEDKSSDEVVPESVVINDLKQCVEHHNAIITLIESIEEVFSIALLAQFMTSIIVICNTLFHIVLVSAVNSQLMMLLNYLILMMVQLFMYCWYGNEIILKSVQIGEACYHFNWYNSGNAVRQYLFIIMERAKRPITITTLKLSTVSLTSFKSILQWSYSCLALLLNLYKDQDQKI